MGEDGCSDRSILESLLDGLLRFPKLRSIDCRWCPDLQPCVMVPLMVPCRTWVTGVLLDTVCVAQAFGLNYACRWLSWRGSCEVVRYTVTSLRLAYHVR